MKGRQTRKSLLFLLFFIGIVTTESFAQRHEIGITGGGTNFIGDVGNNAFHLPRDWYGGMFHRVSFNEHWAIRTSINHGYIHADDAESNWGWRRERNLNFASTITEVAFWVEFNFFPFNGQKAGSQTPYVFGGVGIFFFDPTTTFDGEEIRLQPLGTEGQGSSLNNQGIYNLSDYILPFGVGYKYSLSKVVTIAAEVGFRRTGTDYLDDVSGYYVDPILLAEENGAMAAALAYRGEDQRSKTGQLRGNPNRDDWYIFSGITLSFKLYSAREKCHHF